MRLTGSKVSLLTRCKYPFRSDLFPPSAAPASHPISLDSLCGRALHRAAEWSIRSARDDLYGACQEFGVLREMPRLAQQWGYMRAWIEETCSRRLCDAEVKFALDLARGTARQLTEAGDRNYSAATPLEIPMSLDVLSVDDREPDEGQAYPPTFWDWKTGHKVDGYAGQVAINAVAVAWWLKENFPSIWERHRAVEGVLLHVTPEGIRPHPHRFDAFELAALASDLMADIAAIAGSAPNKGDHCLDMHCEAFGVCPETKADVDRVRAAAELVHPDALVRGRDYALSPQIVSADHAAWCRATLRVYEGYAEEVKAAIEAFVGDQEHPLSEGGVLKRLTKRMMRTSVPELVALARSKGATDDEIAACNHVSIESAGIRVVGKPKEILPKAS